MTEIKNKKVLLVGLGILGGGIATAKWLLKNGANLTITDLRNKDELKDSINELKDFKIKYVLEKHDKNDFKNSDLIVLNPAVPFDNPFVEIAKKNKIPITNELNLFAENIDCSKLISVTGTRGKTTTVNWINYLLNETVGNSFLAGNSPTDPFLKVIDNIKENDFIVTETPSYQLEIVNKKFKPKVAVITNIFRDHINRHKTEGNYAKIKGRIFKYQNSDDFLILNYDNEWTAKYLGLKPKSKVLFFSKETLPKKIKDGAYLNPNQHLVIRKNSKDQVILKSDQFPVDFGPHDKENFMISVLVSNIFNAKFDSLKEIVRKLQRPTIRQEEIYNKDGLRVINDSASTSPEAAIVAIDRFVSLNMILITGGTDRDLNFNNLAKTIKEKVPAEKLILLSGSATEKLKKELDWTEFNEFETLEECLKKVKSICQKGKKETTIVFSPGSKSFEKFKNEFDRGLKFNETFAKVFQ